MRDNARCSPTADECCSDACVPLGSSTPCGRSDECAAPRTCPGGTNSKCPEKQNVPDGELCEENTKSCVGGHCVGSACKNLGENYEPCACLESATVDPKEAQCVVCCRDKSAASGTCAPINEISPGTWNEILYIGDGDICSTNDGYCDVFHRCRSFVEEGLLLKVITRVFSADKWSDFATQYWWAIALILVSLIIIIGVFVHFTAIYTPTQNPNVKQYQGPKAYMTKRYTTMRESRSRRSAYDASDSAANQQQAPAEKKKRGPRMTNQKRMVVVPPSIVQQTSES